MPEEARPSIYLLPLRGKRSGRYKQLIGQTKVLDDEFTREVLAKKTWHLTKGGYPATNIRGSNGRYRPVKLHQLVYGYYHGQVPSGHVLDHDDRDKRNNLPSNIRAVTHSINAANKNRDRDNRSGFKGVSWDKGRSLWVANIRKNGKQTYLGAFADKKEAARAVNAAYREHFSEVAIPNPEAEEAEGGGQREVVSGP